PVDNKAGKTIRTVKQKRIRAHRELIRGSSVKAAGKHGSRIGCPRWAGRVNPCCRWQQEVLSETFQPLSTVRSETDGGRDRPPSEVPTANSYAALTTAIASRSSAPRAGDGSG